MYCDKCGAKLQEGATFCNECGKETRNAKQEKAIRKFRTLSIVLGAVCLALAVLSCVLLFDFLRNEKKAEHDKMLLSGLYIVGEDEELPAGRYKITPAKGEKEIDLLIYRTKEAYDKERETGEWSEDIDSLYKKSVTGYKLREGYVVKIYEPGCYFEKME